MNLDRPDGVAAGSVNDRDLGLGVLESVYETVLARALESAGVAWTRQKPDCAVHTGRKSAGIRRRFSRLTKQAGK